MKRKYSHWSQIYAGVELQLGVRPLMKRTPDGFYRYHVYNYSFAISDMQIKYDHLFESVAVIFQIMMIDINNY